MSRGGARPGAGRPKGQGRYQEKTKPVRVPESMVSAVLDYVSNKGMALPLYTCHVQAGFPSPADDHLEGSLDLNDHLIQHPAATFFVKASGESMLGAGIHPGDILIVDRSLSPVSGQIIIAAVDGHLTVKRLEKNEQRMRLLPENKAFRPIEITSEMDVVIWGVVMHVIHSVMR